MGNQYFDNVGRLKENVKEIVFNYENQKIKFLTDSGVFSKAFIDYGSQVLLKNITLENKKQTILDVGCGYGAIGISLASRYTQAMVDMIDINLRAIDLTKKNIELNGLLNANVFESNVYDKVNTTYDIIVTNPPIRAGKKIVHAIFSGAYDKLNHNGTLFVVIQKKQGAPSAIKKLEEVFCNVEILDKDSGYYILKSTKA